MSQTQLLELEKIEGSLFNILSVDDLEKFAEKLLNKARSFKKRHKKKINIGDPEHPYYNKLTQREIEGVSEAMEEYKAGKGTVLSTEQEVDDYFDKLNKEALYV